MVRDFFDFIIKKDKKLYISPYSTLTKKLKQDIENIGIDVCGFIDKNHKDAIKPSELKDIEIDNIIIISPRYELEIIHNLSKYISLKRLTLLSTQDRNYFKKNIFLNILLYHFYNNLSYIIKFFFKLFNIRFSILWSSRIGEFVLRNEKFIRGDKEKNQKYLLLCSGDEKNIANKTIYELYEKRFREEKNTFLIKNTILTKLFNQPFYDDCVINLNQTSNEYHLYIDKEPSIFFDNKQNIYGRTLIEKIGIKKPYVCVFARDGNYLKTNFASDDYSHHDYRDCDIDTYNKAIEYLIKKGFDVVRVGSSALKRSNFKDKHFFDYSFYDGKNDFLDMFLIEDCEFMIGNTSGLVDVCNAFAIPRIGVNHIPIDHAPYSTLKDIFIPKKLIFNQKYLSLNNYLEMMDNSGLNHWDKNSYTKLGISIEDNSQDEILGVVKEYLGDYSYNDTDESNQKIYQKIHLKSGQFKDVFTKIGADFLKNNRWFIES